MDPVMLSVAKHLLFLSENRQKQILRFTQNDVGRGLFGIFLNVVCLNFTAPALAVLLAVVPAARGARVPLLSQAVVHSATFTLADLLPTSAPEELRSEAAKVPLGSAPQPPMARTIYRQQIEYLLNGRKTLAASIALPSEIHIERFARTLSKADVAQAIDRALASQGVTRLPDLGALEFSAPVYVTSADPGLELIRISSDPVRGLTQFRLWTAKEPGNLPFTVSIPGVIKLPTLVARRTLVAGEVTSASDFTIKMRAGSRAMTAAPPSAGGLAELDVRGVVRTGAPVNRDQFKRPVLVEPGTLSTLIVRGNGFSIKTIVTPLEQGVLGQEIRVRNTDSKQVVEARVTGRDRLVK